MRVRARTTGRATGLGLLGLGFLLASDFATAESFELPANGDSVVGRLQGLTAVHDDTLLDLARKYNLGYEEIRLANPGLDTWIPGEGSLVVLPTRFILPDAPRKGIVLNVAEMRLYYYPPAKPGEPRTVITHPVSIGRVDWSTPLGHTKVVAKAQDPTWYPPASIRKEHAEAGDPLPRIVPPGPDNPLGAHALRLGVPGYLIHGTNKPYGIGMRVSHGCVRMYPEDIASLFDGIPVGTPVHIVDQPVKAGWQDGVLFVEAHPPGGVLSLGYAPDVEAAVRRVLAAVDPQQQRRVDWKRLSSVVQMVSGMPFPVSASPFARSISDNTANSQAADPWAAFDS